MGVSAGSTCSRNERARSESSGCGRGSRTTGLSWKEVAPMRLFCGVLRSMRNLARARSVPNGTIRGFAGSPLQVLAGPNARRYMRWNASSTDDDALVVGRPDRKSTRLNSSHGYISYAVFCLKKKKNKRKQHDSQQIKCN